MNLTSWDLSTPTQIIIVTETLVAGFLLASVFVVHFVYLPWVEKLEEEVEPEKYEDRWKLQDFWDWKELNFDKDVFPNGVPNITFEVQGKKVFDALREKIKALFTCL